VNTLVAGSYPPVPGPAAAATLAAVREAVRAGDDVLVVAPRATAAHRRATLRGWRAASALARLSRGQDRLVLVVEPGMPFGDQTGTGAARALARVVRHRFRAFELRLVSPPELPATPLRPLWPLAGRIVVASEADREEAVTRLGAPPARLVVDDAATARSSPANVDGTGVTPFGPLDWTPREQPRRIASLVIRGVLGEHTDALRARAVRALNAGKQARRAVRQRTGRSHLSRRGLEPPA
jgi:hypothetical protein